MQVNLLKHLELALKRVGREPPFRMFAKELLRVLPVSARTKSEWDAAARPAYLHGVLSAAELATAQGVPEIAVIEFGVAGGSGLLLLQEYAGMVEAETGVKIHVYGFDSGSGLPATTGDYRDHPDQWKPGDYPMDEARLRAKLAARTHLIIGNIADTVAQFAQAANFPPLGFIAIDVDLYSSARDALKILTLPGRRLMQVPIYMDDTDFIFSHRFAGELLAIDEFNSENKAVKIDQWHGIANRRAFPENSWLRKMYVAHDLVAISGTVLKRAAGQLPLHA